MTKKIQGQSAKIKRIIHRCVEEVDATRKIMHLTSTKEGLETFRAKIDMQVMNHNGNYENSMRKKHLLRKHDIMIRYYERLFGDFLKTYDESQWEELRKETALFKLTWKQKYPLEANGKPTFYKYLLDRKL